VTSALLFLSGFAALVYQVLWMRDLAILFGSSAHAAAVDLAVFFGGIATGAAIFARYAARVTNPLRVYGLLELGIAASALFFFLLLDVYAWIYAPLYQRVGQQIVLLVAIKSLLAVGVLGLPTILMGATLPAMVQYRPGHSAWLYGMNTIGATAGAFAAGFFLPPTLGFRGGYVVAVALNVVVGAVALVRSATPRSATPSGVARASGAARSVATPKGVALRGVAVPDEVVRILAFASGALTIGLEVVWLRMFAQVLDNSVYAFSAIIVVALAAFALASLIVARLPLRTHPVAWLVVVLALCGAVAAVQAPLFIAFTDNLVPLQGSGWRSYVGRVFGMAGLFVGVTGLVAGLVFPALLRFVQVSGIAGSTTGRLLMLNTAGAIVGSIATTFVVMPWLGVWTTCAAIGVAYAVLGTWLAWRRGGSGRRFAATVAVVATAVMLAGSTTLPRLRLDAERGERVLELWEGTHGTVAVTEGRSGRSLRMNNSYSLGGTIDRIERERIQTLIPLLLHPQPADVFFLGLGTGITAGEALRHPVEHVVVSELVPEVARASNRFFGEWTRGLASDPRVEVRIEDGRHYLAASDRLFDVVVSDLFVPWHAGTGMLYTREHFEVVRARLRPEGLFVQWLPLFQLNQRDFEVIARTVLDVFPHVVLWRGDFYANRPIVALVASATPMTIDPRQLVDRSRRLAPGVSASGVLAGVLPFYVGHLSRGRSVLGTGPVNTDARPVIEYLSPTTQWNDAQSATDSWFVSRSLARFIDRLRSAVPIANDPYLSRLSSTERAYIEAGVFYYRAIVERLQGNDDEAQRDLGHALERLPADVQVSGPFMALDPLVQ
jgi:spermidine synthase